MGEYNRIHTFALLKTLFIKIFSSRYIIIFIDSIMMILTSIHTSTYDTPVDKSWYVKLILYAVITFILNSLCIFAGHIDQKEKDFTEFYSKAYDIQNSINCSTATKLYRLNKKISESIRNKKVNNFSSIVDFQSLSFLVCNEIYNFIISNFDCGECEITIFQRFSENNKPDFVKMIAYKNSKNNIPSSYGKRFWLSNNSNTTPVFVNIFNDLNADVKILYNHKEVEAEFKYFDDSINREKKICQYIGVPVKTDRNKIEIVLQIDVSKEKSLGKNYNSLKQFSEYIITPFSNFLHCCYERDLIFNKFYDILEENIKDKEWYLNGSYIKMSH